VATWLLWHFPEDTQVFTPNLAPKNWGSHGSGDHSSLGDHWVFRLGPFVLLILELVSETAIEIFRK
jgi:hypothetical protein